MTQIVLMLYEDPKADPQSEHRFHVEMHFSPGAKTMDDPEFLARKSPCRKRSVEDARFSTSSGIPSDAVVEGTVNRAQGVDESQNEKDVKGVPNADPGLTLPPDASTTDSRSTASKKSVQNFDTRACENIRFSSLFAVGDVSRGGTSATPRQKFHTDDVNQCFHIKSGSHGVANANLLNFRFLLIDFRKVLCSSAKELEQKLKCLF